MQTLRLFIPPGWPQTQRECRWALCAADGAILQHGRSEPRHWPGVALPEAAGGESRRAPLACDLILLGPQVASLSVQLPRGAAGQRPEIIAAACEDLLLADPADCQFVPAPSPYGENGEDGPTRLACMARARLAALCATLGELGLQARSAWPLAFLLPMHDGRTVAWAEAGCLSLPQPDGSSLELATADELPHWLARLAATGAFQAWPSVDREKDETARPALAQAVAAGLLQPLPVAPEIRQPPPGGLLNGPLAPPRPSSRLLESLRTPLRLLAGLAVLAFCLLLADWARLGWQAHSLRQEIDARYRQAFPQGAVVDPVLQMQRQLDQARRQAGQLASGDLLTLLAPLADISGDLEGGRLDYDGRRLSVALSLPAGELAALRERSREAGLQFELVRQENKGERLDLSFSLTPETRR